MPNFLNKEKKMKKIPYYISLIMLMSWLGLIINHASRGLNWEPLILILIPTASMFLAESKKRRSDEG